MSHRPIDGPLFFCHHLLSIVGLKKYIFLSRRQGLIILGTLKNGAIAREKQKSSMNRSHLMVTWHICSSGCLTQGGTLLFKQGWR